MSNKEPFDRVVEYIPESFKRLYRFIIKPAIPKGSVAESELSYVYIDYSTALAVVSGVVAALKYLIPDYLEINPVSIINWHIFVLLLVTNTFLFSLMIYALLSIPLRFKKAKNNFKIFYQSIKAFSIENVLIAIMVTVAVNRIIVKESFKSSTGNLDLWIGVFTAFCSFLFIIWLVVIPVASYLKQYYSKAMAYALTCCAVLISIASIHAISIKYFNRIIDPKEFCSQYIGYKYKKEFADCRYSQDYLKNKCQAEIDRLSKL